MSVLTGVLVVVAVVAWACTNASGERAGTGDGKAGPRGADPMVVSLPSYLASVSPPMSGGAVAAGCAYCLWPDDTILFAFTSALATAGLVFLEPGALFRGPRR